MSDYKPHEEDTQQNAVSGATEAIVRAHPTNRYYIFPMEDRVEIAFGNGRHLTASSGEEAFSLVYHSAVSMDETLVRDLHHSLSVLLNLMDERNG